jgi:hypothetical protein
LYSPFDEPTMIGWWIAPAWEWVLQYNSLPITRPSDFFCHTKKVLVRDFCIAPNLIIQ